MQRPWVIVFGGSSEERLVSVASAQNLATHLPEAKLLFIAPLGQIHYVTHEELAAHRDPFTRDFKPSTPVSAQNFPAILSSLQGHTLVLALHGTEGEDGSLQELLVKNNLAFTGTGPHSSRLAFDKKRTKELAQEHNLAVSADYLIAHTRDPLELEGLRAFFRQHYKIVLKPVANGSSVGLFIIEQINELEESIAKIQDQEGAYLAERFISGREITVGTRQRLDGQVVALPCSEVRVNQGRHFDYEGKYLGLGVQELTPAPMEMSESALCQTLAIELHRLVGCEGYARTDMILTDQGPVLLEINTLPGLSRASFLPQQLAAQGESLRNFFLEQITLAEQRLMLRRQ